MRFAPSLVRRYSRWPVHMSTKQRRESDRRAAARAWTGVVEIGRLFAAHGPRARAGRRHGRDCPARSAAGDLDRQDAKPEAGLGDDQRLGRPDLDGRQCLRTPSGCARESGSSRSPLPQRAVRADLAQTDGQYGESPGGGSGRRDFTSRDGVQTSPGYESSTRSAALTRPGEGAAEPRGPRSVVRRRPVRLLRAAGSRPSWGSLFGPEVRGRHDRAGGAPGDRVHRNG